MSETELLQRTLAIARQAVESGNLPFGCLLADANGDILEEAGNTVVSTKDTIAHCEINLVHQMAGKYEAVFLQNCSVYASTEPCPMCTGALYWSGVGRIVYALGKDVYHQINQTTNLAYIFNLSCSDLLQKGGRVVMVAGPLLEEEARQFYTSLINQ
ncbi:MAG TPA: nucleoside deaminase [Flavisolibacter sp.]|jgi:tRNA(Arg) A34 adenosine deaminase TadA|nr:nucleoside deaminase [Flavisolibacter sp.]